MGRSTTFRAEKTRRVRAQLFGNAEVRGSRQMLTPRKVLVVDDNPESRFLLTKTLMRKFPQVIILECGDADTAVRTLAAERLDIVVVHRATDVGGVDLVEMLREVTRAVPIIMVSGIDRSAE